ncbi:hypothetical protein CAEBREN_20121 [Caenorhabditis brenneri]|uniref:Uncharacterized protein n=1 Tax=Caenorhabditis brenneri TaxID=135651 RepID=G0NF88_CAEBE|nr:hypothetical protein CAEBREN_20121 [Caenorhabditis brenneri]
MIVLELFFFSILAVVLGEKVKRQEQVVHEIPKFKRGPIVIVDETALTNPNSFDYDFSDDLNKPADKQDLYDQFIDQLPMFHIYKLGTDRGVTQVPIVTRAGDTWFTPSTISNREQKFTFYLTTPMTPKKPAINRGPIWRKGGVIIDTTTSPRPLTTPRQWTVRGFRVRVSSTTTTTEAPTTTRRVFTTERPTTRVPWWKTSTTTTTQAPTTRVPWWKTTKTTTTEAPTTQTHTTQAPWWKTTAANRWVAGPRHPPRFNQNQNWQHPIKKLQETVGQTVAPSNVDPINRSQPKPVVIHSGRYAGPTYNCRVLNPFTDGHASSEHDSSCKMLYPGLSLDGTCRCFYKVAGRDEHGCATGFIYACRALGLRSISV